MKKLGLRLFCLVIFASLFVGINGPGASRLPISGVITNIVVQKTQGGCGPSEISYVVYLDTGYVYDINKRTYNQFGPLRIGDRIEISMLDAGCGVQKVDVKIIK